MWRTLWSAQFRLRGIGCGEFERESRRGSLVVDRENVRRRPRWCSRGGGSEPGASTSPGGTGRQAAACSHACAWRCLRGGCAGQGAGDPHRITVATPILSFLSLCEFRPKFEMKPNFHQNESCAKFYKLQIIFWCPKLILSGRV